MDERVKGAVQIEICCPICCKPPKHSYMMRAVDGTHFCPNEPHPEWRWQS